MPLLSFEVHADYQEAMRLRQEIDRLERQLKSFGPGSSVQAISSVEAQLKSARAQFNSITAAAAQAGASLELNIRKGANGAIAALNDLQSKLANPIQGLTQIAGVAGLGMFLNNVTKIRGQFQLMESSINTLLGSAEKGKALMAELTEYAKVSPLDFQGTVGAAQMMLGFGIDQQKILPFMKALGDVSMGDAQRFQSLTLAFSQMSAAGKLMGQDLMQMVNAGFQPLDQLAKDTGKSIGKLKEEMSAGKISAEMVQQAFINATSEGGKFYNMSQNATNTISGQMSMLGDAMDLMYNDLGTQAEGAVMKAIQGATYLVEHYKEVGGVLGTAVATFGIYKASVMASEFAMKAAAEERTQAVVAGFEEEIAKMEEYQREQALMAFDGDVRSAMESGNMTDEVGQKIQSMREELKLRLETAQAAKDAADTEVAAANDSMKAAQERLEEAQGLVDIANESGDASDKKFAAEQLDGAQMEYNAAATGVLTAETNANAAAKELSRVQTQADTVAEIQNNNATNLNTASQTANTAATTRGSVVTALMTAKTKVATIAHYAYTGAINACKTAYNSLKVAMATNPFGMILTALSAVIGLFMTFKDEAEDVSAEVERFGESASKTKNNVNTLYAVLDSVNKDSKVYRDSLDELTKVAKDYGIQIDSEKDTLDQLNEKRALLIKLIEQEGEARQLANRLASYEKDKTDASDDFVKDMKDSIEDESKGDAKEAAEQFARIIADTVERKKGELKPMVDELEKAQKEYAAEAANGEYADGAKLASLSSKIAGLQTSIAKTANEEAKNYAKAMGLSEDYILDIKDTSKYVSELTNKITTADKFIDKTRQNAQALNDEAERTKPAAPEIDYKSMDASKLTEELTKATKAVKELNDSEVKPLADPINIHNLFEEAKKAEEKIGDVDNSSAAPSTDNSALEDTENKGTDAENKMKDIDNATATPYIDTKYIDIALDKLNDVKYILKEVGGQVLNTTATERQQLAHLAQTYGKDANGRIPAGTKMTKADYNLYHSILAKAKRRSNFKMGGKNYQLSREQSAVLQQIMDNPDYFDTKTGIVSEAKMSAVDKRLYQQFKNDLLVGEYNTNKSTQTTTLKNIKSALSDKISNAKTTEEFAEIRKGINTQMQKVDQSSELYKYYEKTLKELDKKDKSKKNKSGQKDDPKQRAYELQKQKIEEERRIAELTQAEKNRQQELTISQMEDNSEKEIATIKFTYEKKRQTLEKELQKEADVLEKNALQEWLKGGKNRKEYQYYAQFSAGQLKAMREEYRRQASENIGYDTQTMTISVGEADDFEKVYRQDAAAMRDYLKQYGTFQQKKLAITEEYAEKIRNAQNKGEELTFTAQRDAELRDLESKAITSQIDWYSVFDNVGVIMRGQLEPLYKQLQSYVKTDAFRKSGADNQQTVIQAMENIRSQLGTNETWRDLSSALIDYQSAMNELRIATENDTRVSAELAKLTSARNTAQSNLDKAKSDPESTPEQIKAFETAIEAAQSQLDSYSATVEQNSQAMTDAQNRVQSSGTMLSMSAKNVIKPVSQIYTFLSGAGLSQLAELWGAFDQLKGGIDGLKALNNTAESAEKLSEATESASDAVADTTTKLPGIIGMIQEQFPEVFDQIKDAVGNIGGEVAEGATGVTKGMQEAGTELAKVLPDELLEGLGKAGIIGQIIAAVLKILDILKDGIGTLISSILDSIFQAISGIIENILSGELFKQIGESLYKGILGIFKSIFTMGGLFDWWGNGDSDKDLEDDVERLSNTNEALRKAVEELTEVMEDAAVADATDLYQQQKSNIEQAMANTQEMMSRSAAAYSNGFLGVGGTHSSNKKIDDAMSSSEWKRISTIVGKSINSASDFWNLTSEQMAKIAKDAPDLYAKIKQYADDGYKDAAQYMDEYIEYYKELEELEDAYREKLTDVSFDSVKDEFKSMLLDMESDTEDFADNFESMMQQAVINSLMSSKYNDLIESWYKEFSSMMEDGTLTEAEQTKLKKQWDDIVDMAVTERDSVKKAMGWDGSTTQQSSSSTLQSMSQDTGNAIEGRLTAMQIAVEAIRSNHQEQTLSIADLNDDLLSIIQTYNQFNVHYDNIERQMAKMYVELQTISENTGAIVKPIQSMQEDIAEIKRYTKNI